MLTHPVHRGGAGRDLLLGLGVSLCAAVACKPPPPGPPPPEPPPDELPRLDGAFMWADNSRLEMAFSEGVFLQPSPHAGQFHFVSNGGTATGVSIADVGSTTGGPVQGGETTVVVWLQINGTPSGVETFEIVPRNWFRDSDGNPVPDEETTGPLTLNPGPPVPIELSVFHSGPGLVDPSTVPAYEVFELTFVLPTSYGPNGNFFEVDVSVDFTDPSANVATVGGFYYDTLHTGESLWKARFAPSEVGAHTYSYSFSHAGSAFVRTGMGTFDAIASSETGFVRTNGSAGAPFVFDNGQAYYPHGWNSCILDGTSALQGMDGGDEFGAFAGEGTVPFADVVEAYSGSGFNMYRFSGGNCTPHLADPTLQTFDKEIGKQFDHLVQALTTHDVRVYFGLFGYLLQGERYASAAAIVTVPAWPPDDQLRRYVDYVVNRFGAYVDVWEILNEALFGFDPPINAVAAMIRDVDPYQHIVTTGRYQHWATPPSSAETFAPHYYTPIAAVDADTQIVERAQTWRPHGLPIIVGEIGTGEPANSPSWTPATTERRRVQGWAGLFESLSVLCWESGNTSLTLPLAVCYTGPAERQHAGVLSWFAERVLRADSSRVAASLSGAPGVRAYQLSAADRVGIYLHPGSAAVLPITGATVTVDTTFDGEGVWLDPTSGTERSRVPLTTGSNVLTVPDISGDLAFAGAPTLSGPPNVDLRISNSQEDGDLDDDGLADYGPAHQPFGIAPLSLTLDASNSYDVDGGALTASWDFGDGSPPASTLSVAHTFGRGTFLVRLTLTDDEGQTAHRSIVVRATGDARPDQNDAPILEVPDAVVVREGQMALVVPKAIDRELSAGQYITDWVWYSAASLPPGAVFDTCARPPWMPPPAPGEPLTFPCLSWVPTPAQAGVHAIDVTATDEAGASTTKTVSITVLEATPQ